MTMQEFNVHGRPELHDDYHVFYVTAWGYAADHLFGWFPKALNCHHDIFALLAHEGSRPKYLKERTRGERPPLVAFTEFLNDMGMTYSAIGDCYSYRAGQMPALLNIERYRNIPVLNLVRHPLPWLEFYVRWRASNMRMRLDASDPLAWEWKTTCHAYFSSLGLHPYDRDDVGIWTSYQGMFQLNNILGDLKAIPRHQAIEHVADDPALFREAVAFLTAGHVVLDQATIDSAFSIRHSLFRGEEPVLTDPREILNAWPGWKVDAFRKIVMPEALAAYTSLGYDITPLASKIHPLPFLPTDKPSRPVFVCSVPKSGTWLLREIIEMATGLKPYEPPIGTGTPDYRDEMLIDFPPGTFFSWHAELTPRSVALLRGCQAKNIFLIRNVYDQLLSMFHHLSRDVDHAIGRSVIGSDYFSDKTIEQSMSLMIAGFTSLRMTWLGVAPLIRQIDGMLELAESGEALLLDYERLVTEKRRVILEIARFIGIKLNARFVRNILAATDREMMRNRLATTGKGQHVTLDKDRLGRKVFLPYHKEMIDLAIMVHAPDMPKRLQRLGFDSVLSLEPVSVPLRTRFWRTLSRLGI